MRRTAVLILLFEFAALSVAAQNRNHGPVLRGNEYLGTWEYLVSSNGAYSAMLQDDGSFCVFPGSNPDHPDGPAVWCSPSAPQTRNYYESLWHKQLCVSPGPRP